MSDSKAVSGTCNGTLHFMSPEALNYNAPVYRRRGDVYAFGCTMLNVFTGKVPFHDLPSHAFYSEIYEKGKLPDIPDTLHPLRTICRELSSLCDSSFLHSDVAELIRGCLCHESTKRLKLRDVCTRLSAILDAQIQCEQQLQMPCSSAQQVLFAP